MLLTAFHGSQASVKEQAETVQKLASDNDGNFHVGYLIHPDKPEERETAEKLNHQLVSRALALEGTCTGEHGVGLHKMDFLLAEAGAGAVEMMRTIKRALDPKNIMNPGKIFSI